MPLVSRKGILAIAAVIDVALNTGDRPVSAKMLAARYRLPPRHLEPVPQALVRDGILKGVRGPRGGYALGRERSGVSAKDIIRAARLAEAQNEPPLPASPLISDVVRPALAEAERAFSAALARLSLDEIAPPHSGLVVSIYAVAAAPCSRSGLFRREWSRE
jgi:Rrf2 family iron-sulfur cluster assembly transcriptional regulator